MYKRKTRLAARLLSIVLAAGMSVSGVSVSALAAEVSEEPAQQETVVTQEAAEEPEAAPAAEEENEEVTEADVPAEPKDEAEAKVPVQGAEEESIPAAVGTEVEAGEALSKDAPPEEGFYTDEYGDIYYYMNGEPICGDTFSVYDEEDGVDYYYRSYPEGMLLVDEWYEDGSGYYYYGKNGRAPSGLFEIYEPWADDESIVDLRCFDYDGRMMTNTVYTDESGVQYEIDGFGIARLSSIDYEEGWNCLDDGSYMYVESGRILTSTVEWLPDYQTGEERWYGFDDSGLMYQDCTFQSGDDWDWYRAYEDGHLYANEWYGDDPLVENVYYYQDNAAAATDVVELTERYGTESVLYCFDKYDAYLLTNIAYYTDWDGVHYSVDENGIATVLASDYEEGWNELDGGVYVYVVNGDPVTDQVMKIGNYYYGFDYNGIMYDNTDFSMYDYYYYRAKSGGALIVNNWYQSPDKDWYYYGAEGKGAEGIVTLGGVTYAFDCARMLTDTEYEDYNTGDVYRIAKNGVAKKVPAEGGWFTIDNKWYYYDPELVCYSDGIYDIKGTKYGFNYYGVMYDNCRFGMYVSDEYDEEEGYYYSVYNHYRAKSGGPLVVNDWYKDHGTWYYYGSDGVEYRDGKYTITGTDYYFGEYGELFTNGNIVIDGCLYHANASGALTVANGLCNTEDGRLVYAEDGQVVTNTWKTINNKQYYFGDDGYAAAGVQQIDGKYYYFDVDHVMAKSVWVDDYLDYYYYESGVIYATADGPLAEGEQQIGGKYYYFGDTSYDKGSGIPFLLTGIVEYDGHTYLCGPDGARIAIVNDLEDGWFSAAGTWYYIEDKNLVANEEKTIDGATYYFDEDGKMVIDKIRSGKLFGSNGVQVKAGWYQLEGEWTYVDPATGQCVNEEQTINGKQYYFRYYRMVTGDTWVNGEKRTYGSDGVLKGIIPENQNGWTLYGGRYYYYENGEAYTGWVGNYYVEDGVMETDTVIDGYYLNDVGLWVSKAGWTDGGYRYVKSNGKVASEEWVKVGSDWYYFGYYGYKYTSTSLWEDGYIYYFDANGKLYLTIAESDYSSRWFSKGGSWYYIEDGHLVTGDILEINGTEYGFAYSGKMITNDFFWGYYFTSSGALAKYTGWKQINGKWYYFGADHYAITGWVVVNGVSYYIDYDDGMVTGNKLINGRLYNFNSSGALTGPVSTQNGWVQCGSDWCYFRNGAPLSYGIYKIGNTWYGFKSGVMATNDIVGAENGNYYVNGSGIVSFSKGWRQINGTWYYFDQGGKMLRGLQVVDGTLYNLQGYGYYYGE